MRPLHFRVAGRFVLTLCAVALAVTLACSPGEAQRRPTHGGGGGHDRGGGGGGGLPNVGRFILKQAPGILREYGDDDDDGRRYRPKRRREVVDDYDDDDDDYRPKKRRVKKRLPPRNPPVHTADDDEDDKAPPRRVTAIPPLPEAPERVTPPPPPTTLAAAPFPQRREAPDAPRPDYRDDEIVVMVRGAEPDTIAADIAQGFNLVLQETISFALLAGSRVYRFSIPDNRAVETILPLMANIPGVGFAVPNGYYRLQGSVKERSYDLQYALPKMRVPDARAMVSGRGMTVAVIDSGVDANHPSLKDTNLTLYDAMDRGIKEPDMHGTAITGIIAASGDMVGIAPEARIIAVRAFAPEKLGTPPITTATTLAKSVDAAFSRGARIFNMSFAGRREPLLIEIIDAAYEQGAVFVAAAGNEGPDAPPAYPAAHDKVIAITATDASDALYDSANRGGYVLAAAPGVDILAPVTGQGFDYLSGTSFAAAHVTGVIALLMERNPQLTATQVRNILVNAAHDLGDKGQDDNFGAGLTDAYGALLLAEPKVAQPVVDLPTRGN